MDVEARIASSVVRSADDADEFKSIVIFCGLGLLLSLVAAMLYGLDFLAI